ncbi:PepSY domain-containing protein [Phytopseudomonas dryadis]|uniref:PepSY domain-containing protein n=1 Tax=Phytopseudomonas dryadis TaxID=2487520 RepID=A0A4Q9QX67_9GAMM|nr:MULTISPECIES: PepSY domain-containing protein [Pseudomonas]TBU89000.1 PepSY domain-containing protein [Pseudomonas dryadis]TBV08314.1 PepSY domain-containing protein [Pseudomonas dryadis]TBV19683.1 PepSY domain-containing protein [Pseudomonas sp. FRB 230]
MLKKTLTALTAAAALSAGVAMADRPGADWISIDQALSSAKQAGFTQIHKIEADDDGYWEGKGLKQDNRLYEFRVDGKSGKLIREQLDD